MRKASLPTGRLFINILLIAGLIGILAVYAVIVSDLPSRLYTADQWAYLSYNTGRSITQSAPTFEAEMDEMKVGEGEAVASDFFDWKTKVNATLQARYEAQSGVNITVYDLDYQSEYLLTYPGTVERTRVTLFFPFPNNLQTLHDVSFLVDGEEPPNAQYTVGGISWQADLMTDRDHTININYKADGVNSFAYGLQQNRRSDVDVTLTVLGVAGSQVPQSSLPPTDVVNLEDGERFSWEFPGLIPNRDIQINLPRHLSYAQRVAQLQSDFRTIGNLAPILIGTFLLSLAALLRFSGQRLPFESYLMIGFALALFYPALTFLSGLLGVAPAAVVCLVVVSALVIIFMGFTIGFKGTWWRVGILLVVFLGIFSLGLLTPWHRLLITGGGLVLAATFMITYARRVIPPEPEQEVKPEPEENLEPERPPEISLTPSPEVEAAPEETKGYCPQCGRERGDDYAFCPGCGYATEGLLRCQNCSREQHVSTEVEEIFCLHCGDALKS
jgi:hypothetical protein